MPAPTLATRTTAPAPAAPASSPAPVSVVPFMRASRKKNLIQSQLGPYTLNTGAQPIASIPITAVGFLRRLRLTLNVSSTGNTAAVAFQPDAPFNLIQQITLVDASNDVLIQTIDGFTLAMVNKWFAMGTGFRDPLADPYFKMTSGAVATGGSFQFHIDIPVEIDTRDAFCALQNEAAQLQYRVNVTLNAINQIYATAPTNAPSVTITASMDYYATPAAMSPSGAIQATAPYGNGSISTIQTQTPTITSGSAQKIPMLNVGNTIRAVMFILRDGSGVRTEADWPNQTNIYVNTDPWYQKTADQWRKDQAYHYRVTGGVSATPALNTMDAGVYILDDFICEGSSGDDRVNGACDRNQWLVTGSQTGFDFEAVNWGANAKEFLIVTNVVRTTSDALYSPHWS